MFKSPTISRRHFPLILAAFSPALGLILANDARAENASMPAKAAAGTQTVRISNFAFAPAVLTVAPGTTVTWTNMDEDPHTVVSNTRVFRSGALDTGDRYSFTFAAPGDYAYFCSLHPHMTARIIVRAR